ncbi:MAG: DUF2868 domain-containing protein [Ectothiorhodospiraceae bacterium]|nr:DUF2868 domain-containing protein [Ectothiorhodospiraceae bacterium]MCH8506042.1 DUF2868 domain-containing protein [Ectothiorhodospiraceae bacterium]
MRTDVNGRNALLLAWAVRSHADGRTLLLEDTAARDSARQYPGTDEARLLHWLVQSDAARRLQPSLDLARGTGRALAFVLLLFGALGGVVAGASALQTGAAGVVDIPLAALGLVGVQLLFLLLWLLVLTVAFGGGGAGPDMGRGWPGRVLLFLLERVARVLPGSDEARKDRAASSAAVVGLLGQGRYGQWLLGGLTHSVWLAFSLGALASTWLLLVTVQYDFAWGTTLLAEDTAAGVLAAVAWLPGLLGLPVPDADMVAASRLGAAGPEAHRQVWAQFLLWVLIVYGVFPRAVLALACGLAARRSGNRLRLDQGHPLFQEALIHLRREQAAQAPLGERPADVLSRPRTAPQHRRFGAGDYFAMVGMELDRDDAWPPQGSGWQVIPMLHVRTRADIRTLLSDLQALASPPRFVLVVASLVRSPDRGATDLLTDIAGAADAPVLLVLAEAALAEERGVDVAQREADWRERAAPAGVEAVMTADWDALQAMPQNRLEQCLLQAGVA